MNTKTCKDCPCAEPNHPTSGHGQQWLLICRLEPHDIARNNDEWCYRGRQIIEEEEQQRKYREQREKEWQEQITQIKRAIWTKKCNDIALTKEDLNSAQQMLEQLERSDIDTDFGVPVHFLPMRPRY